MEEKAGQPILKSKTTGGKGGVAGRLAMFEDMEERAGNKPPSKKKATRPWRSKTSASTRSPPPPARQKSEDRNLKPSLVSNVKKWERNTPSKAPSGPPKPPKKKH